MMIGDGLQENNEHKHTQYTCQQGDESKGYHATIVAYLGGAEVGR